MNRFRSFARKASKNHRRTCFVLKCDIRKFFANIDHDILFSILSSYIPDENILWLLKEIVGSFGSKVDIKSSVLADSATSFNKGGIGLPLGNLTSQLLVNIYMNEFDQFMKHKLKVRYYIRYADDFIVLSESKAYFETLLILMRQFLSECLRLELHPDKVFIKTLASGADYLSWVHFPDRRVLRTSTKRRMAENPKEESVSSYLGMLCHGNAFTLQKRIKESYSSTNARIKF